VQQSLRNRRYEWRPEMQIGYVEDSGRHIRFNEADSADRNDNRPA
jgi:hypothetical protein